METKLTSRILCVFTIILLILACSAMPAKSQTIKIDGVTYELPKSSSNKDSKPEKVGETTIDGKKYPIYKGKRGGLYIIRTSKSGKEYKQYLKKKESK